MASCAPWPPSRTSCARWDTPWRSSDPTGSAPSPAPPIPISASRCAPADGSLGLAARRWARREGVAFTTAFHTRFAEYLRARTRIPLRPTYAWLRRFHGAACGTMVATESLRADLAARGFGHLRPWSRGVDLDLFRPDPREDWALPRPVFLYVGRVAIEKNIGAFLDLDLPGSKVVVGDGPQLAALRRRYPATLFTGPRHGAALASAYAGADVFVFPSRTDTFGLV